MSDRDLLLEKEIRQVLADLELISHGTITAYNSSGAHGESVNAYPPGERQPPHLAYRQMFHEAADDQRRRDLVRAARAELIAITRRPERATRGVSDAEVLEERILAAEGWSAADLARTLRCTPGHVRRIRNNNGRDGDRGDLLEMSITDRAELAAKMAARKVPQAEIAKRLGISQPTVSRLLKTRKIAA